MSKRYTDTDVWKKQRWFKKLSTEYKLVFYYIKDMCDNIGIWKIDCSDLIEDTGIEDFDLEHFITCCNKDHDRLNGKETSKERLKIINEKELWITGFVQFQYESKETGKVSTGHQIGGPALLKLKQKGLYEEAIKMRYLFVFQQHNTGPSRSAAARNGSH